MARKARRGGGSGVDGKLRARIAEWLEVAADTGDADACVEFLRERFDEYKRKPMNVFMRSVESCLAQHSAAQPSTTNTNADHVFSSDDRAKKRKTSSDDESQADAPRPGGNLMNQSLRRVFANPASAAASAQAQAQTPPAQQVKKKKKSANKSSSSANTIPGMRNWKPEMSSPTVTYADVGGVDAILQEVRELIEWPLTHPEIYAHLGVQPPRGILLHGPPGCGKTLLANAIAGELGANFIKIAAPEIVSGMSGESEAKIRMLFEEALNNAPCLLFLDEIDAITPKRENAQREMERRIVAQLLTCLDSLSVESGQAPVMVIGATNRPDALDPALRRAGRFDREIALGIPDEPARARILQVMCRRIRLQGEFDFDLIAGKTAGFVGADLEALTKESAVVAVHRIFSGLGDGDEDGDELANKSRVSHHLRSRGPLSSDDLAPLCVSMADFVQAVKKVQPSSKREGFATIPDVTWDDIGALHQLREELSMAIIRPIKQPGIFHSLGLSVPCGVLMYGPPGCGKTLLAKAVAADCRASFISVKGPELLNKYVGESERAVRQVFDRARSSAPCIIFFDELDALAPKRGQGSSDNVSERLVNQLLTELDGLSDRKQVFVVAATNRPDIIDPAMLRPGRLDKLLYVPLPSAEERFEILNTLCRDKPLTPAVDLRAVAFDARCDCFSGADCSALVREAAVSAIRRHTAAALADTDTDADTDMDADAGAPKVFIEHADMVAALDSVLPSVSPSAQRRYDRMRQVLRRSRAIESKPQPQQPSKEGDANTGDGGDASVAVS